MLDGMWPWPGLGCVEWEYTLVLSALCVTVTLVGVVNRAHRLLRTYYLANRWPGVVHREDTGPGTVCGECGHRLAVHDAATGRCCHGTPLGHLAVIIALPLPLLVRDMVQEAGCPCRLQEPRK
ncbi:hypothetical protein BJF83_23575 [Nocardiopsis sp. CNR-923]|uniref:hypothetical protein n=1 Tax=Nocardiopsis sp. CNR-923 TaxID=1904965 RepID=UPI000969F5EE|nr:hypothetical protein [Nocardiopsis sp. CNR-923]OLT24911.1 hypothetical protein BJF83_23575 [Nocardiopsis sp. CNR-923]